MASRVEEKRRRREEREALEAAARASHQRQRNLQIGGAALLIVAAIVVIALVALNKSSSSSTSGGGLGRSAGVQAPTSPLARIPAARNASLTSAAKAAGCVVLNPPDEGFNHVNGTVVYHSNPPTSGNHNPTPALDGVYAPGNEPAKEHYVHTLEHGRVELQYRPGTSRKVQLQLQSLLSESFLNHPGGYKTLLFENNTNMPYAVAATAWDHLIGCKTVNNNTWDALRDFRNTFIDKGRGAEATAIPPNDL